MEVNSQPDVIEKLTAIQLIFKQHLPDRINEIELLWNGIDNKKSRATKLGTLYRLIHSLAGSGGTFGAESISRIAREIEQQVKPLCDIEDQKTIIPSGTINKIEQLLGELRLTADNWQPSKIQFYLSRNPEVVEEGNLIFLGEDDELLAADLIANLEQAKYQVRHFTELAALEAAYEQEKPVVIIMDIVFKEGDVAGTETIAKIQKSSDVCPPIIFISVRDDIDARLAAARAGANRYFCKPLNMNKLILTLDGLTARTAAKPYRILIIDDDETLLEYYSTVLLEAGMEVKAISKPMETLPLLTSFNPDIIVLDVYMPECTGPELAQVIRQDDTWALIPIMFLSTESNLNRQLVAMNLGGDDFLLKPIEAEHLVSAVTARAKRARWTSRLNQDLSISLRESEYQRITMNQHDSVSSTNVDGVITDVNDLFCSISGYSRAELLGQNHRIMKSDHHPVEFYKQMWKTITAGEVWHGIICNRKKDGKKYWVESTIVPFLDENGKPYKYVSARTDISALRISEERLHRSQVFSNIGNWDWNIKSGELYGSELSGLLFGYPEKEIKTSYEMFLEAVHPEDKSLIEDAANNCLNNGAEYNLEHRVVWPDGTIKWVSARGNIVRDKDGKPLHMLGLVQDINDRVNTEKELVIAREEAENANHAKSKFLSSMSHELRTPMNSIMGFAQLLMMETDPPLTEAQAEYVREVIKAGDHLMKLINEILNLAKIEAGGVELSLEKVLLADVINESLQLILPLAEKRGIEISLLNNGKTITTEELLQQTQVVQADPMRLKQVLLNLLSNGVKYNNQQGKLTIACDEAVGSMTRISITDTGKGISSEQQGQLFKAFSRLGAENLEIEGTGIGLVISKTFVELMGGNIGIESSPGEGSTFWFELPSEGVRSELLLSPETNIAVPKKLSSTDKRVYTVLYIEDNPANLKLLSLLFENMGNVRLQTAHEPILGIEFAEKLRPDLILLDINLPGMNGYQVLEHLRTTKITAEIPVVAVSANAMPKDIAAGMEAGFDEYITKPIDITVLLQVMESNLSGYSKE